MSRNTLHRSPHPFQKQPRHPPRPRPPEFKFHRRSTSIVDVVGIHYPDGSLGCVSCDDSDGKWRITFDQRPWDDRPSFDTMEEAAQAEYELCEEAKARTRAKTDGFTLNDLFLLWEDFLKVPVTDGRFEHDRQVDTIMRPFRQWPVGTHYMTVFSWFEDQNGGSWSAALSWLKTRIYAENWLRDKLREIKANEFAAAKAAARSAAEQAPPALGPAAGAPRQRPDARPQATRPPRSKQANALRRTTSLQKSQLQERLDKQAQWERRQDGS